MRTHNHETRWLGVCQIGLGAALALLALLGPLGVDLIDWRIQPTILSQL
jgi:hypothetical protein